MSKESFVEIAVSRDTVAAAEGFIPVVEAFVGAERSDKSVHLDFRPLGEGSGNRAKAPERLDRVWLACLANLVLSRFGHLPLRVTLPTSESDQPRLAFIRSGLPFALTHRSQSVGADRIAGAADSSALFRWLDLWRVPWNPLGSGIDGRLFDDEPRVADAKDTPGGRSAARESGLIRKAANVKNATRLVVDFHRQSLDKILADAAHGQRGWVTLVTPRSDDPRREGARQAWGDIVTNTVLTEVLTNVKRHAFTCPQGAPPLDQRTRASLLFLARTDGGGPEGERGSSHPRLHLLVHDNGHGIPRTFRPKLDLDDDRERSLIDEPARAIVQYAIELGLAARRSAQDRAEATVADPGLPWVRTSFVDLLGLAVDDRVEDDEPSDGSQLAIVTSTDDRTGCVLARAHTDGTIIVEEYPQIPVQGTVVMVNVPMPHPSRGESLRPDAGAVTAPDRRR